MSTLEWILGRLVGGTEVGVGGDESGADIFNSYIIITIFFNTRRIVRTLLVLEV